MWGKGTVQIVTQVIDHLVVTITEKGIVMGQGNLETGTSQHCNLQEEYFERP